MSSTPLVQVNDHLIINLFQVTRIRFNEGAAYVHMSDGGQEVLQGDTAARFLTYVREVSDNLPEPVPVPEPGSTSSRDFAAVLGDDAVAAAPPAQEPPADGESPPSA